MGWSNPIKNDQLEFQTVVAKVRAAVAKGLSYVNSKPVENLSPIPALHEPYFQLIVSPSVAHVLNLESANPFDMRWCIQTDPSGAEGFDIRNPEICPKCFSWHAVDRKCAKCEARHGTRKP